MQLAKKITFLIAITLGVCQTEAYKENQIAKSDSLLQSGNTYEAIEVLKALSYQMIESASKDYESIGIIFEKIGEIYYLKEDNDSAIDYFDRAIENYNRFI